VQGVPAQVIESAVVEYVPGTHGIQRPLPEALVNVPAGQLVQVAARSVVEPRGPNLPAIQAVPIQADDPALVEYVPEGQIVQLVAPVDDHELSVTFFVQTSVDVPEYPAEQGRYV